MTVHDRREKTLRCLELLHAQKVPVDVYLTDDGCTDGTPDAVRARFPGVHVIPGDGSLFWCRGMRRAWEAALGGNYDVFLWLNDDTYLFPDAMKVLQETAGRHPGCIVVGMTCSAQTGAFTYGGRLARRMEHVMGERPLDTFDGNIVWVPATVSQQIGLLAGRRPNSWEPARNTTGLPPGVIRTFRCGSAGGCSEAPSAARRRSISW